MGKMKEKLSFKKFDQTGPQFPLQLCLLSLSQSHCMFYSHGIADRSTHSLIFLVNAISWLQNSLPHSCLRPLSLTYFCVNLYLKTSVQIDTCTIAALGHLETLSFFCFSLYYCHLYWAPFLMPLKSMLISAIILQQSL